MSGLFGMSLAFLFLLLIGDDDPVQKSYEGVRSESTFDCASTQEKSACIRPALIFSVWFVRVERDVFSRRCVCLPADGEVGLSELDPMEPRPRP